jgi:predicted aspartyl protease
MMRSSVRFVLLLLLCFTSTLAVSNPQDNLNNICGANAVAAKVNGAEVYLAIDPSLKSYVILNPDSANKVGLTKSSFSSAETYVRDKLIKGNVAKTKIEVDGKKGKTRVIWFERNYIHESGYDGVIGLGELGAKSVKLEICNHNNNHDKKPDEEFYSSTIIPFKYQNNRIVIDSLLPDKLNVMLDFNRSNINIGSDAYSYILSQGMLSKLNEYAYQELEFGYYLPSRRVLLHSPVLKGMTIDAENVFTPIDEHQMVDDQSGGISGKIIDATEDMMVYGYKAESDGKFKSFVKLGRKSLPDCRSITFDLKKKLINFSCLKLNN